MPIKIFTEINRAQIKFIIHGCQYFGINYLFNMKGTLPIFLTLLTFS